MIGVRLGELECGWTASAEGGHEHGAVDLYVRKRSNADRHRKNGRTDVGYRRKAGGGNETAGVTQDSV
jgi:hypothetical protein